MSRTGKFYIAPQSDPGNPFAAGYDGNVFETEAEAEAELPNLAAVFRTSPDDWCVWQYKG